MSNNFQKGIVIVLSLFVLSAVLAIAMGVSTLLFREVEFSRTAGFYVPAFFAADSGIEKILMLRDTPDSFTECTSSASPCALGNGANFWIVVSPSGIGGCAAPSFCIESTGEFRGTRRAVEVNY